MENGRTTETAGGPSRSGENRGKIMLDVLRKRFEKNMNRHPGMEWAQAEKRLKGNPEALAALARMEESGGEPDVLGPAEDGEAVLFCDCAKESPAGRRSLCYDAEAFAKRTKNPPAGSAVSQAEQTGAALMTEEMYRRLQETGEYDLRTSTWIRTPEEIRRLGGALFCERRYGRVFTFHNGADSYYSVRGWRGYILV